LFFIPLGSIQFGCALGGRCLRPRCMQYAVLCFHR
jgi:hypothetical protein